MALELGGRLKECVVMLSKVWTYMAELSGEEKQRPFFQCQDSFEWQTYPDRPLGLHCLNADRSLLL